MNISFDIETFSSVRYMAVFSLCRHYLAIYANMFTQSPSVDDVRSFSHSVEILIASVCAVYLPLVKLTIIGNRDFVFF